MWVGKCRTYVGEDNIVYVTGVGDVDYKMATQIKETTLALLDVADTELSFLLDLSNAGKPSPEARKIFQELGKLKKIRKVATFGIHPVARIIATFGMGEDFTKKYHRFFRTKEEALAWLKE